MTTELEIWLKQATRKLSKESTAQVWTEIQEHYQSAREAAIDSGSSADEADRITITALGSAKTANCQYRSVLLTSAEARTLREGNWEARAVCSRPWLKWLLRAIPMAPLFAAAACLVSGEISQARVLLVGGLVMVLLLWAPFLPIYAPSRGRVFRIVKWVALVAALALAFNWSWLLIACLWPIARVEQIRVSIRRKLPVSEWPKQLYL